MGFNSKILKTESDGTRRDISSASKKTLGDYLRRRVNGESEPLEGDEGAVPIKTEPSSPGSEDAKVKFEPENYTSNDPANGQSSPNAYGLEESDNAGDGGHKFRKFAKEYEEAKWTFPETLMGTRLLTRGIMNGEKGNNPKYKRYLGSALKDVISLQGIIPDPIDAIIAGANGEIPFPTPNPITLAMQAEIQVKLSKNRFTKISNPSSILEKKSFTEEKDIRGNAHTWISKSKAYRGSSQQSISHTLASSLSPMMLTDGYQRAMSLYGDQGRISSIKSKIESVNGADGKKGVISDYKAISKEDVHAIESRLESQYVPFYIHDLRTNEILNFHAFVENVSDSYTSNWNDSEGYGRMDAVQTYKNTTRSISVDFYVVSTSEKDFDRVWWTINRLVMMVYPQWSEGTQISGESNGKKINFIQPFSQVITSSPIVRLRVGDIIASNYSRLNLARSFGLGMLGNFVASGSSPAVSPSQQPHIDKLQQYVDELRRNPSSFTIDLPIDPMLANPPSDGEGKNIRVVFASTTTVHQGISFLRPAAGVNGKATILRGAGGRVKEGKTKSDGSTILLVQLDEPIRVDTMLAKAFGSRESSDDSRSSKIEYVLVHADRLYSCEFASPATVEDIDKEIKLIDAAINEAYKEQQKINASFTEEVSIDEFQEATRLNDLRISELQKTKQVLEDKKSTVQSNMETAEIVTGEFSGPSSYFASSQGGSSNSIIRSFEDAGGRGLAGSIRSLSFDWNEAPWETAQGSRAPIWCKVSMQFNPIHDIPMGLDHEGMPRSVPYPVGETVRETFFPELYEQSKKEKVQQQVDNSKFWGKIGDEAEEIVNGYIGRSLKRIF